MPCRARQCRRAILCILVNPRIASGAGRRAASRRSLVVAQLQAAEETQGVLVGDEGFAIEDVEQHGVGGFGANAFDGEQFVTQRLVGDAVAGAQVEVVVGEPRHQVFQVLRFLFVETRRVDAVFEFVQCYRVQPFGADVFTEVRQRFSGVCLGGLLDEDGSDPVIEAVLVLPPVLRAVMGNERAQDGKAAAVMRAWQHHGFFRW